ncbi:MAG: type II toxin-antitoxin system VapC family toxin [Desulfovermiculus sp.]
MSLVADTNVFIAVALNEPEKDSIVQNTQGYDLIAPNVLPFEVGNALTAMMKKGTLHGEEILHSWKIIEQIPVELRSVNMKSALEIAMRFQLHAYDAFFLECAYSLRLPLITLDRGMRRIAQKMGISIVE